MKKILLYLLLLLFIAGFATLAYGFWNAKSIRHWAVQAEQIRLKHDISVTEKNIEEKMNASGGKKPEEFNAELEGFVSDLDPILKEMSSARTETEKIYAPRAVSIVRGELSDFYSNSGIQVENVSSIAKFMHTVFTVTSIFDKMNPDTTPQEIRDMITEAQSKSSEIDTETLPDEMKSSGNELKVATDNYLDQFDQFATGKIENHDQLNASYADFSEKVNDFLLAKKKYLDSFENLDLVGKKIDGDLTVLQRVRFSIK